jgi:hypothetical protein
MGRTALGFNIMLMGDATIDGLRGYDMLAHSIILQGLRDVGDSIVLMGKNTMMKRSIRLYCERTGNEQWTNLMDYLVGNVGLVFTKADLSEVKTISSLNLPLSLQSALSKVPSW